MIFGFDLQNYFFAQAGEDAILQAIFQDKLSRGEKGFYVDVGAHHPQKGSNTYLFYRNGWTGINIDAMPGSMKAFKKLRPKDLNLEIGISGTPNIIPFYLVGEHSTMNSFSKDFLIEQGIRNYQEIPVKVIPLQHVLDLNPVPEIDFLTIDVEGYEVEVIKSNDWKKYRPRIVVIEMRCENIHHALRTPASMYMREIGYEVIAKNIVNGDIASVFFKDMNYVKNIS